MTNLEFADQIFALQEQAGGVTCVRAIVHYIRNGLIKEAQIVYFNDGDKIRSHNEIQGAFEAHWGCRLHCVVNCLAWPCKR